MLTFPKPSQIKKPKPAVRVYPDGREVCNLKTKAGRDEYSRRKRVMWDRQGGICSLRITPRCRALKGKVKFLACTFEHDEGRGSGGSRRQDRIEKDGKPINSIACWWCNAKKGSVRKSQLDELAP
jgi:hypothetical protein